MARAHACVGWALGSRCGGDTFVSFCMVAAVLKLIFLRASRGSRTSHEEMKLVRNAVTESSHDDQVGNLITRIALAVSPLEGETRQEQVAAKLAFSATHLANLQGFIHGTLM